MRECASFLRRYAPDAALIVLFLLVAVGMRLLESADPDRRLLIADAKMVAGIGRAEDHPEAFRRDYVYHTPANFRIYVPAYVQTIRFLAHRAGGDYYRATRWLLEPFVFLHLFGYYWLGKRFSGSRWFGLLYTFAMFGFRMQPIDNWGMGGSPQLLTRLAFAVYFPFALYFLLRPFEMFRRPILSGLVLGTAVWIHPVSAPGLLLAYGVIWALYRGRLRHWKDGLAGVAGPALALGLFAGYVFVYGRYHSPASRDPSLMELSIPPSVVQYPQTLFPALGALFERYAACAGLGLFLTLYALLGRAGRWRRAVPLACLIGGYFLICAPLCYVERLVYIALNHAPPEIDLPRGLRYVMPLLLLALGLPLRWPWKRSAPLMLMGLLGGLLILRQAWLYAIGDAPYVMAEVSTRLRLGDRASRYSASRRVAQRQDEALEAIRGLTPAGAVIHCSAWPECEEDVRAEAMRPVFWAWSDQALLTHSNHPLLPEWRRRWKLSEQLSRRGYSHGPEYAQTLWREGIDYWLLDKSPFMTDPRLQARMRAYVVWENPFYWLLSGALKPTDGGVHSPAS